MATPDTKHSIVITKEFGYRGGTRRFSNRYHFEGDLPADNAAWTTFANAIVNAEKLCYQPDVTIVEAIGYDASTATSTNPHGISVFTKTYTTAGSASTFTSMVPAPGDCALLVRYSTPARTSRNHPVYLFNYYHGVWVAAGDGDTVSPQQVTLFDTYSGAWVSGFSDGSETHERCGPRGAVATSATVDTVTRHRDFPN